MPAIQNSPKVSNTLLFDDVCLAEECSTYLVRHSFYSVTILTLTSSLPLAPPFFDLLDFLLRVPSLVHAFSMSHQITCPTYAHINISMSLLDEAEEYPYLSAIIIILIGLEPVLFCTKTLWEGLMYHLGCHPLTFRPGEVFVSSLRYIVTLPHLKLCWH